MFSAPINREYVLIAKEVEENQPPQSSIMSFDGINDATIVDKNDFSGEFQSNFAVRMWMKHSDQDDNEKEHIFCKSDEKCK